jgi:uncharacterized SAM-binding protein YcdF (DUF218 family)
VAFVAADAAVRPRRRRLWIAVVALLALAAWQSRARVLTAIGTTLTVDDPPARADVTVVSLATARADALEVAALHRDGFSPRIVLARWQEEPLDDEMRRLGAPWVPPHELAVAVLEKSGVPADAIQVLDDAVDGLNTEVSAIARFARTARPASLLYVTARTHGRRAFWLLRRLVPEGTTVLVRAPALDPFRPEEWWHSRARSREVAMEYLRWANTFGLHDFWRTTEPPTVGEPGD